MSSVLGLRVRAVPYSLPSDSRWRCGDGDGVRTQACNKLREIYSGLSKLENLVMLDFGGNRLRKMEHLPTNLEKLFLGKNKIERVENVSSLKKLKVLDVQSNRLTSLEPGSLPSQLQELYGAHNAVTDPPPDALKGLSLETVDLSHNRLTSLEVFAGLQLGDLWLSYNGVPSLDAVGCLKDVPLTCLYLDHNPSAPARESHSRGALRVNCAACATSAGCVVAGASSRRELRTPARGAAPTARREPSPAL